MSRWKAAAIHLGISLTVILAVASFMTLAWYPPDYVPLVGGLGLIGIVAAVDACIGPLLTLIVFDVRKPSLPLDLSLIALVQALALAYGVYVLYGSRPAFMVYTGGEFHLITGPELSADFLARAQRPVFRTVPLDGPKWAASRVPRDEKERSLLETGRQMGFGPEYFPQNFVPYTDVMAEVPGSAWPAEAALDLGGTIQPVLKAWLANHGVGPEAVKLLPVKSRRGQGTVLVDARTGAVLDILPVPWDPPGSPANAGKSPAGAH